MNNKPMTAQQIIDAIDAYTEECDSSRGTSMSTIVAKNKAIAEVYELCRLRDRISNPETPEKQEKPA